ncbi:Putative oligopeptide transporter HI_0561 [Chlamydiales bacterium SCGC AB-751-O23]|jgi:putative OPT family oligopeptide transporter|nr:Putative oligopeptide transporter HI_0561 [Chlamydiales bacterium SCGC AB-751-O23]
MSDQTITQESKEFNPYIPSESIVPEFTLRSLILGLLLSILFGAANAFLGLKVGITVSASIPAAVVSMAVLRTLFKRVSVLENNMVQTIASAGETLAAGVIYTLPALFFFGEQPSLAKVFWISVLGGGLGILYMIPLRSYLVKEEHENLPFPEGTACYEIIKAGEQGGAKAAFVFTGGLLGVGHRLLTKAFFLIPETPKWAIKSLGTMFAVDVSPALMGVGYILGARTAAMIFSGSFLAWFMIIPLIQTFSNPEMIIAPATTPIGTFSPQEIWSFYIRYIGAGAVVLGGVFSLIRSIPVVYKSIASAISEGLSFKSNKKRTERDLPMATILLGITAITLAMFFIPEIDLGFVSVFVILLLGFFFVTVTGVMAGIVGSSANPVSGMIITTVAFTSLLFVYLDWTSTAYMMTVVVIAGIVCNCLAIAADCSQDLKTGFLLGSTPWKQQIGEFLGVIASGAVMGAVMYLLHNTYVIGSEALSAPQASMVKMIIEGVMGGSLPWNLIIVGIMLGLVIEMLGLPVLPFALGFYLPIFLSSAIMVGGLVALVVSFFSQRKKKGFDKENGLLLASGLVAGDALTGVFISLVMGVPALVGTFSSRPPWLENCSGAISSYFAKYDGTAVFSNNLSLLVFVGIALVLAAGALKRTEEA